MGNNGERMNDRSDGGMTERKTDLAMEVRESFPRDNVEIKGVVLEKKRDEKSGAKITVVEIKDEKGSKAMKKPQGTYITIESEELLHDDEDNENLLLCICKELERMVKGLRKKRVLIAGLGNRHVTSDSLGPRMVEEIFVTRHYENEFGSDFMKKHQYGNVSAIAPGVMGQTGMEAGEVLKGVVEKTHPELVIVVDALAARSLSRVCTTVQLTDTGISPGSRHWKCPESIVKGNSWRTGCGGGDSDGSGCPHDHQRSFGTGTHKTGLPRMGAGAVYPGSFAGGNKKSVCDTEKCGRVSQNTGKRTCQSDELLPAEKE